MFIFSVHLLLSHRWKGTKFFVFCENYSTAALRDPTSRTSATVDNDAHFKTHDKTKQSQHVERQPPIRIVQCQMSIASAALAIQITSLLCFAFGCGRKKPLIMVFIYPPARLITPALVPLTALADALEILQPSTVGGNGAGWCPRITLCPSASFHHTQPQGRSAEDPGRFVTAHTKCSHIQ